MSRSKEAVAEKEGRFELETARFERMEREYAEAKRALEPAKTVFAKLMAERAILTNENPHRATAVRSGSNNTPSPPQPSSSMGSQSTTPGYRKIRPSPPKIPVGSENTFLYCRALHPDVPDEQLRATVYQQMMVDRTMNTATMMQQPTYAQQGQTSFGDVPQPPPPAGVSRSRNGEVPAPQLEHTQRAGPSISKTRPSNENPPQPNRTRRVGSPMPFLTPPAAGHANASDLNERAREQQKHLLRYGQQWPPPSGERAVAPVWAPPVLPSSNTMPPATMQQYGQQGPPANGERSSTTGQSMPALHSDSTIQAVATVQNTATGIEEHAENEQLEPTAGNMAIGHQDDDANLWTFLLNDPLSRTILEENLGGPVRPPVQRTGVQGGMWEQSNAAVAAVTGQPGVADLPMPAYTGVAMAGDATDDWSHFNWESNVTGTAVTGQPALPDLQMPTYIGGGMMGDAADEWMGLGGESQPTVYVNGSHYTVEQIMRGEHQRVPAY